MDGADHGLADAGHRRSRPPALSLTIQTQMVLAVSSAGRGESRSSLVSQTP